jgi:hypothetical protein
MLSLKLEVCSGYFKTFSYTTQRCTSLPQIRVCYARSPLDKQFYFHSQTFRHIQLSSILKKFGNISVLPGCTWKVTSSQLALCGLNFVYSNHKNSPIPVAARSKAWVCSRSLDGIAGSNPAGGMDFFVSCECLCCQVEGSATGRSLIKRSHTEYGVSECDRE